MSSTTALSLAMARDGSSGGVIRLAVITESGVVRHFYAADQIPTCVRTRFIPLVLFSDPPGSEKEIQC